VEPSGTHECGDWIKQTDNTVLRPVSGRFSATLLDVGADISIGSLYSQLLPDYVSANTEKYPALHRDVLRYSGS